MPSDNETNEGEEKPFCADRAKSGRAGCKKCKQKIESGSLRIGKVSPNPFGSGKMKMWYHVNCMFEVFSKQRATTAKIESPDDVDGWDNLGEEDQEEILSHLPDSARRKKPKPKPVTKQPEKASTSKAADDTVSVSSSNETSGSNEDHRDNAFREFRKLCMNVANASSYLTKTAIIKEMFTKGTGGDGFHGDLLLWCRLLLPGAVKRVYNLQSKQLVKLFSRLFGEDHDEMLEDLEQGDVAETICKYFERSTKVMPSKKTRLTIQEVDRFLEHLAKLTREEDQLQHFASITEKCTSNDLKMIIRLVKHDLRINAGPKHILEAVHPDAYQAFQTTRDIDIVVMKCVPTVGEPTQTALKIDVKILTPVLPMLAEVCKSVGQAIRKCPNGMYSEVKYDGERVQVHKKGSEFKYFSRSLKPVLPHKVNHFKDYIPQAFPHGKDLILDSEILMIDTHTGNPLPFGSLGIHKKSKFKDANVCLFVFDCIYYNGQSLLQKPIKERRRILKENMKEMPNHIVFSEAEEIHDSKALEKMMTRVFKEGLEGLVLKDLMSIYEPGKRHWLKIKKDYLMDGAMADSADLVVLGAWYGTGQKGGMMSVFLMGCYDPNRKVWCTVTKVHTGHDDKTLERLQTELDMVKISKDMSKVPSWLSCTKTMVPDFVAQDPKAQPVWEITGAEFTKHDVHTAAGISVRFPRVTRIRADKTWETATSLPELKVLYEKSKDTADFVLSTNDETAESNFSPEKTPKKRKQQKSRSPSPKRTRSPRRSRSASPKRIRSRSPSPRKTPSALPSRRRSRSRSPSPSPKKRKLPDFLGNSSKARKIKQSPPQVSPSKSPKLDIETSLSATAKPKTVKVLDSDGTYFYRDIEYGQADKNPANESDTSEVTKKRRILKKNPLPDVFVGVKLFLPTEGIATRSLLERYFIAYGGELVQKENCEEATHLIVTDKLKKLPTNTSAHHVDVSWLWDSIKLQELQDPKKYEKHRK